MTLSVLVVVFFCSCLLGIFECSGNLIFDYLQGHISQSHGQWNIVSRLVPQVALVRFPVPHAESSPFGSHITVKIQEYGHCRIFIKFFFFICCCFLKMLLVCPLQNKSGLNLFVLFYLKGFLRSHTNN